MFRQGCPSGLIDCRSRKSLQLSEVNVSCKVVHLTSLVDTIFVYKNHLKEPIEASFTFPLADVAVFRFEATIEDRCIVAECRPKKEAQSVYDEAVTHGHTAFIAHQDEDSPDVFSMSVGRIPVDSTVSIKLTYAGHLEAANLTTDSFTGSQATFILPSVICPRYCPAERQIEREFDILNGQAMWVDYPYTISFEADLRMPEVIDSVHSERDKYSMELDPDNSKCAKVKLDSGFKPDHCLEMIVRMKAPLASFAVMEAGDPNRTSFLSQTCLMAQFMPDFSAAIGEQELRTELIFIVDRSGSMSGSRIQQASESLMLFLGSLPLGCRFQIIGFGSSHSALFPEPVDYNEDTLARAKEYQSSMEANMGGTEILGPLRTAFDSPLTGQGWYKEVILLTDGDVHNANEVVGLVASNVHKARVFSIGIGSDASTHLIQMVAHAGRGLHSFVRDESQLRAAVVKILTAALQPRAQVTELRWNLTKTDASGSETPVSIRAAPNIPPPIFNGAYSTVYAFFDEDPSSVTGEVILRVQILDQEQILKIPITNASTPVLPCSKNASLHRLAGKCLLNELNNRYKALQMERVKDAQPEDKEAEELKNIRLRIEQLSCLINIISPYTSFVGVDPLKREVLSGPRSRPSPPVMACAMPMAFRAGGQPRFMKKFAQVGSKSPTGMLFGSCSQAVTSEALMECDSVDSIPSCPAPPGAGFGGRVMGQAMSFSNAANERLDAVDKSSAKSEPSTVVKLVHLQHSSGYWPLTEDVATLVGLEVDAVRKSKPKKWPSSHSRTEPSENIWSTLIVLCYLEIKLSQAKDEWVLIARKAKKWLENEAKHAGAFSPTESLDFIITSLSAVAKGMFS